MNEFKFKSALVGATGLVGSTLLPRLLDLGPTLVLSRKPTPQKLSAPHQNFITDFSDINLDTSFENLYYCFGTTLKTAGSKENFKKIEIELGTQILKFAQRSKVKNVFLLSSSGANSSSSIYYSHIKGLLEDVAISFKFEKLYILRPSLLLGERTNDFRAGELIAQKTLGKIRPLIPKLYRPVTAIEVSRTLIDLSALPPGVYENDKITAI